MVILMLMGHIDACLFWMIDTRLSPPARWVDKYMLPESSLSTQYLVSYISALKSLVLRLRLVSNDYENIYVIFEFIAGILSYGIVFGNIHSIVEMMDSTAALTEAEEYHKFEMDWVKNYMRETQLPPQLQQVKCICMLYLK
jgi:hypothetical protein